MAFCRFRRNSEQPSFSWLFCFVQISSSKLLAGHAMISFLAASKIRTSSDRAFRFLVSHRWDIRSSLFFTIGSKHLAGKINCLCEMWAYSSCSAKLPGLARLQCVEAISNPHFNECLSRNANASGLGIEFSN